MRSSLRATLIGFVAAGVATKVEAQTPESEARAALADLQAIEQNARPGVRYLSLYALPPARRTEATRVVGFALNSLSRGRAIVTPTPVSPTLLRVSISHYVNDVAEFQAWSKAWEQLAESDAYFHLRTEVVDPSSGKRRVVTVDGGWIDPAVAEQLRLMTGSRGAVLRADSFVNGALVGELYYRFAGIAEREADFTRGLGIDRAAIERLRADAGANVLISRVTQKPRRVVWTQGPLGGFYQTLDVERVDAERDPVRRPVDVGAVKFRFDATEIFAMGANGLWRVALYDAAGRQQAAVPDRIAKDTSEPLGDGIVVPLVSCVRCHREAGLRPFRDDQTKLLAGGTELYAADPTIARRAAEFYDEARLQRQMEFDRQTYTAAVARATGGWTPERLVDELAAVVRQYSYVPIEMADAAREIGVEIEVARRAFRRTTDPILLLLADGHPVLRGQWESSFQAASFAVELGGERSASLPAEKPTTVMQEPSEARRPRAAHVPKSVRIRKRR